MKRHTSSKRRVQTPRQVSQRIPFWQITLFDFQLYCYIDIKLKIQWRRLGERLGWSASICTVHFKVKIEFTKSRSRLSQTRIDSKNHRFDISFYKTAIENVSLKNGWCCNFLSWERAAAAQWLRKGVSYRMDIVCKIFLSMYIISG